MHSVLYLHGLASSPGSDKPVALARLLEPAGIGLVAPDLNVPSFEALDFDAMVQTALRSARKHRPAAVIGSSLGCAVALEAIRQGLRLPAVLIAPAIGISDLWISRCPAGDPIAVWNHARSANAMIHRAFFERMSRFDADDAPPSTPVILFIGTEDESIPYERVREVWRRWSSSGHLQVGARFVTIDGGDHRLMGEIERIADEVRALVAP